MNILEKTLPLSYHKYNTRVNMQQNNLLSFFCRRNRLDEHLFIGSSPAAA